MLTDKNWSDYKAASEMAVKDGKENTVYLVWVGNAFGIAFKKDGKTYTNFIEIDLPLTLVEADRYMETLSRMFYVNQKSSIDDEG